jgi:hypothetical protein
MGGEHDLGQAHVQRGAQRLGEIRVHELGLGHFRQHDRAADHERTEGGGHGEESEDGRRFHASKRWHDAQPIAKETA